MCYIYEAVFGAKIEMNYELAPKIRGRSKPGEEMVYRDFKFPILRKTNRNYSSTLPDYGQ